LTLALEIDRKIRRLRDNFARHKKGEEREEATIFSAPAFIL